MIDIIFVCCINLSFVWKGSGTFALGYGLTQEYFIASEIESVEGCYERLPQRNKNDFHPASSYPIYRKISGPIFYLMLENAPRAHWIISSDLEGRKVMMRKT